MHILITGGAGFVGSSLALALKKDNPAWRITALDNLKRRGSELSLSRLKKSGVDFIHGDVRNPEDLEQCDRLDLILECSAEPSVKAGYEAGTEYLVKTNLFGTINCLELARRQSAGMIFISTSRVYPIAHLRGLPLQPVGDRLSLPSDASGPGWSAQGISDEFPINGFRSLYGATKLASELLIAEYREMFGIKTVINRAGVLTGPWQMGKVDQGFFVLWAARHFFGKQLSYQGFGGNGLQVRDVLHVADLYRLIAIQIERLDKLNGSTFNVGGGLATSVSLKEMSGKCAALAGREIAISANPDTHPSDVPWYVTDNAKVSAETGWKPRLSIDDILAEIMAWLKDNRVALEPILG